MILLKWRKNIKTLDEPSFVSYKVIGKLFGIDGSSVRRLIKDRIDGKKRTIKPFFYFSIGKEEGIFKNRRFGMRYLTEEHKAFLRDPETLHNWISLTLKERCVMFHR